MMMRFFYLPSVSARLIKAFVIGVVVEKMNICTMAVTINKKGTFLHRTAALVVGAFAVVHLLTFYFY